MIYYQKTNGDRKAHIYQQAIELPTVLAKVEESEAPTAPTSGYH